MAASIKELKEKLAYSCNILAHEGHWDNILGHVSFRIPGQNRILMKPIARFERSPAHTRRRYQNRQEGGSKYGGTRKFSSTRRS